MPREGESNSTEEPAVIQPQEERESAKFSWGIHTMLLYAECVLFLWRDPSGLVQSVVNDYVSEHIA